MCPGRFYDMGFFLLVSRTDPQIALDYSTVPDLDDALLVQSAYPQESEPRSVGNNLLLHVDDLGS